MKNKRIIYWGGNHQTTIPRMGACGSGTDPSGGSSGAGSGNTPPKEPGVIDGAFAGLGDLLGELGLMAVDMAKGELVQAFVDGALITFQKNRDPNKQRQSCRQPRFHLKRTRSISRRQSTNRPPQQGRLCWRQPFLRQEHPQRKCASSGRQHDSQIKLP